MGKAAPIPRPSRVSLALAVVVLAALGAAAARAQPFDSWLGLTGNPTNGWVAVPDSRSLDISGPFTFEAWVSITNSALAEDCRSIAGKNWKRTWWVGQCSVGGASTLRSYLKGSNSQRQGGVISPGIPTHVAVVFDGSRRLHYINGELAAAFPETGPLPTNDAELRIGSDVEWAPSPTGWIDEVRLWNVARSEAQIRADLNKRIAAQAGLVARWTLDGSGDDAVSTHDGSVHGAGAAFRTWDDVPRCDTAGGVTAVCLRGRFIVKTRWRTNPTPGTPTQGVGGVAVAGPDSAVFFFFASDNWEVMVKALDACVPVLGNRFWIFSAATTDVFYRMEVLDTVRREQKIYFNYPGSPAPAVTDTDAFATCP